MNDKNRGQLDQEQEDSSSLRARIRELEETNRNLETLQVNRKTILYAMDVINKIVASATDLDDMLDRVLSEVLNIFSCDRAWLVFPCDPNAETWHVPKERTRPEWPGGLDDGVEIPMDDFSRRAISEALANPGAVRYDSRINPFSEFEKIQVQYSIRSQLIMAIYPKVGKPWLMGLHHCVEQQTYSDADCDLFEVLCARVCDSLSSLLHHRETIETEKKLNDELETRVEERAQELKKSQTQLLKLSRAVEQSPNAVFITDLYGIIEYVNPKFTVLTGFTPEEALGQNPRILKSPDTPRDLFNDLWRTIRRGDEWKGEIKDQRKNGSHFWAYETIAPVKDEIGNITHYVATHEDIAERKDAELAVQIAFEKAAIASRAKSDLMANMSHELRTPLNAIIGFSEAMKVETFGSIGSDKNREYLDDIHNSGQHLLELINDILDASAIEAGALEMHEENVNLKDVIDASVRLIRPRAEAGQVTVISAINSEISLLYADKRRVKQILLNLLSNAVKFTPEGGEVSVSGQLNDNGSLAVSIADTGIGMDEEDITLALSTFGQVDSGLDRKHEGTGLGLPLTKGLIELHGGSLVVKSNKGHGTSVTVTFPRERVALNVR